MKRILIPLCIVVGSHVAYGQRSYQFDAPDRLFVEGKELFSLKNYAGCIDKLEAYKQHSTNADLIQEADYMLAVSYTHLDVYKRQPFTRWRIVSKSRLRICQ